MSVFGFSTQPSSGGDFTPILKYDARAGRFTRVDRVNDGNGFANDDVDITQGIKFIADFENVEVGWLAFTPGAAPSFVLVPIGSQLPPQPSENHKNGLRFMLKLSKECGGEQPVREIAGNSKAFLSGVEAVYTQYLAEKAKKSRQAPGLDGGEDHAGQDRQRGTHVDQLPPAVQDQRLGGAQGSGVRTEGGSCACGGD